MYVVEHEGDVGEGVALIHLLEVDEHSFVEFTGSDDEEGVVDEVFDDFDIDDEACRCGVDNDVVVGVFELCDEFVESAIAKQFGGVGRYGAGEEGVDTFVDEVGFDEGVPIVNSAGEVVGESRMFSGVEGAGEGAFAQVEVEENDFLAGNAEAGGDVGGDKGLTHAGEHGGDHDDAAFGLLVDDAEEVEFGAQQTEGLGEVVVVVAGDNDGAVVFLFFARDFAEEGDGGGGDDVAVEFDFGVYGASEEEESDGERESEDESEEGGACLVGGDGDAVDVGGVKHFAVGFDGGLADEQLFAAAQQVEVELFFDFLQALEVLEIELFLGDLAHFRRGRGGGDLCFGDAFLQHADIAFEEVIHAGAHVAEFLEFGFDEGAVGSFFVGFEFEDKGVVGGNQRHYVLVVEVDGGGDDAGVFFRLVDVDELAGLLELFFQAFDFFFRLDGGLEVVLSEGGDVEQLVFAFEVGECVLLCA